MLGPTTLFVVTISVINAVKVFETVKMLTDGGPNKASEVLLFTIYQEGFVYLRVGYASAMTVVFLAILVVLMLAAVPRARPAGALHMTSTASRRPHHPLRAALARRADDPCALHLHDLDGGQDAERHLHLVAVAASRSIVYFAENFAKAFAKVPMATLLWNGVVVCGADLASSRSGRDPLRLCDGQAEVPRPRG